MTGIQVALVLQRLSQDAKQALLFRGRIEAVDKWMSARKLPTRLRTKIAGFYAEASNTTSINTLQGFQT